MDNKPFDAHSGSLSKLKSKQGDAIDAFLNATLEEGDIAFVKMPLSLQEKGKLLKLNKTLYSLLDHLV